MWQMDATDELVYLCVHAARHHFDRITLIADLTRAFQRTYLDQSPESQRWAERPLISAMVCLGHTLARKTDPDLPDLGWAVIDKLRARVNRLANTFWPDMLAGKTSLENRMAVYGCLCTLEPNLRARSRCWIGLLRLVVLRTVSVDKETASRWGMKGTFGILLARLVRLTSIAFSKAWLRVGL